MDDYTIPRSPAPLYHHLLITGGLALLACLLVTFFFYRAVPVAPSGQALMVAVLWISVPLLWAAEAFFAFKYYSNTKYVLTQQALAIRKKGMFGMATEKLYRYDAILSVNSFTHANGAYGSIQLALEHEEQINLRGIARPGEHALNIKKKANDARTYKTVLQ